MPAYRQYTRTQRAMCVFTGEGETFGLVGESGCGKSTLGRTLIRMYEPTGGQIIFDGEDITKLEGAKLQPYHKRMQIIFQDPYSALDPHHNVEEIIREPMSLYTNASKSDIDEQIVELLKKVGMNMKESVLFFLLEVHFLV